MSTTDSVLFFNVEGIPVTIGIIKGHPYCARWDFPETRWFDPDSARRNGKPLSESEFKTLLAESHSKTWEGVPPS